MSKLRPFIWLLLLLVGCGELNSTPHPSDDKVQYKQLSTNENAIEQHESNQVKERLRTKDGLTNIYAVNTDKKMIVAFEIDHLRRFQLKDYERKITKEIKKEFSNMDVTVSTDQKIIIEVEKLEQKLESNSISKKELDKKLKHLFKLSREKT